jgi:SAM-dependent methyltransferase
MQRAITECLVCGHRASRLLHRATYRGGVAEAHRYFLARRQATAHGDIRRCEGCGFTFTSPQFEDHEYDTIYSRLHQNSDDSATAAPAGPGDEANEARFKRLHALIAAREDFSQPFLDFGCGDASFLRVAGSASARGFEIGAPGQRPGPAGSTIHSGQWPQVAGSSALPFGSQAFVTTFDVFEHLPNLERDVALIGRVLAPGGRLYVTVPDIASPMARLTGGRWNMLLLEHLWYFSPATLDRFLARFGFAPVAHARVPYDASLSHAAKRLAETLGARAPRLPGALSRWVLPVPAGVMFAAYRLRAGGA